MSAETINPRLIVKNFGAIKELDIEIKPLMIFIGNQGTGKSTVAKLLAIFRDITSFLFVSDSFKVFSDYNINFINENTMLEYLENNESYFKVINKELLKKSPYFIDFLSHSLNPIKKNVIILDELKNKYGEVAYIPTERLFISTISNYLYSLLKAQVNLPNYVNNFGSDFTESKIDDFKIPFLDKLIYKDKKNDLLQFDDLNFTLDTASSGIQSSLPMAMVLNFKSEKNFKHFFIIEEPELNLYPTTQKRLVNYLAEKTINKGHELIVTTHSPYILTSFANLIQAGNVAKEKPHLKAELENIVPSQYWLDFDKVGVYYFENGTCRDLLDYENKTIDATAIDDVSEIISKEFDQILDLKYRA